MPTLKETRMQQIRASLASLARNDLGSAKAMLADASEQFEPVPEGSTGSADRAAWFSQALIKMVGEPLPGAAKVVAQEMPKLECQIELIRAFCALEEGSTDSFIGAAARLMTAASFLNAPPRQAEVVFESALLLNRENEDDKLLVCVAAFTKFIEQRNYRSAREWLDKAAAIPGSETITASLKGLLDALTDEK